VSAPSPKKYALRIRPKKSAVGFQDGKKPKVHKKTFQDGGAKHNDDQDGSNDHNSDQDGSNHNSDQDGSATDQDGSKEHTRKKRRSDEHTRKKRRLEDDNVDSDEDDDDDSTDTDDDDSDKNDDDHEDVTPTKSKNAKKRKTLSKLAKFFSSDSDSNEDCDEEDPISAKAKFLTRLWEMKASTAEHRFDALEACLVRKETNAHDITNLAFCRQEAKTWLRSSLKKAELKGCLKGLASFNTTNAQLLKYMDWAEKSTKTIRASRKMVRKLSIN
jgi:hypothetical protein